MRLRYVPPIIIMLIAVVALAAVAILGYAILYLVTLPFVAATWLAAAAVRWVLGRTRWPMWVRGPVALLIVLFFAALELLGSELYDLEDLAFAIAASFLLFWTITLLAARRGWWTSTTGKLWRAAVLALYVAVVLPTCFFTSGWW